MKKYIYLDHAATTATRPEVVEAMLPYFTENFGNASSVYELGSRNKEVLNKSRETIAAALGADATEIYFTAGGSESDNWALKATAEAYEKKGRHIITTKIEHHAILHTCEYLEKRGFEVTYLDVDADGRISLDELQAAIRPDTILISVMFANNEIGTIEPIREIGAIAKEHGILFHTDAVQAAGHIPLDVRELGCDMMSVSAHKLGGLRGAGLLYIRRGLELQPLICGGGQENGLRSGTENTAAIVSMGAAMEYACGDINGRSERISALRDRLVAGLLEISGSRLNGGISPRLCGNVNVSFSGVEGESLVLGLDIRGVCASSGSACSSGNELPSHVLRAMGVPEDMLKGSLRLTLSEFNTADEVETAIRAVRETVETLRELRGWEG